MAFFESLYILSIELLSFWIPIGYAFKFIMDKDNNKIRTILKFWSIICCFQLFSLLLQSIIDQKIFPWINMIVTGIICLPPYQIVQKVYDSTLGAIFKQNKQAFVSIQDKVIAIFDKNKLKLSDKVQKQTGQKMKGLVGNLMMAAATSSANKPIQNNQKSDSDQDSNKSD